MSYTVLARKYRSADFDELVGQEHIARTLKKAIESGRIAHAFLFCGTRGTGKTSTARILAKSLNCENSKEPTTTPCGKCNSCQMIARGDDIDVIEIDAASQTGVDNIRDLIANAQLRPARSRFKIYIIDEVHMLSKGAFNALLKTLEEPPSHVKFILCTTEPEKVLPTILSRCQRYDFRNIPTREIAGHLKAICKEEKINADDDALLLIAKAGAGSMRDALSLLDRLLSVGEKELTIEMIEQLLGMPKSQAIFDLAQSIGEGDAKDTLERAGELIARGLAADTLIASLTDHLRNLLVLRTCGEKSELVEVPGLGIEELNGQAQQFAPAVLSQDIAVLEDLRRSMRSSSAGRALLDATLVRLALAAQFASVQELLDGAGGSSTADSGPALKKNAEVRRSPLPAAAVVTGADDSDDELPAVGKVWKSDGPPLAELLKQHESVAPPAAAAKPNLEPVDRSDLNAVMSRLRQAFADAPGASWLNSAAIRDISDSLAVITFPASQSIAPTMLERGGKREKIQETLGELIGQRVSVRFEVDVALADDHAPAPVATPVRKPTSAPPAPAPEPQQIRITPELKEQLKNNDPLIAAVMTELGAEIVRVE